MGGLPSSKVCAALCMCLDGKSLLDLTYAVACKGFWEISPEGTKRAAGGTPGHAEDALSACKQLCHRAAAPDPILICIRLHDISGTNSKVGRAEPVHSRLSAIWKSLRDSLTDAAVGTASGHAGRQDRTMWQHWQHSSHTEFPTIIQRRLSLWHMLCTSQLQWPPAMRRPRTRNVHARHCKVKAQLTAALHDSVGSQPPRSALCA